MDCKCGTGNYCRLHKCYGKAPANPGDHRYDAVAPRVYKVVRVCSGSKQLCGGGTRRLLRRGKT